MYNAYKGGNVMKCKKCGSENVSIQMVEETKKKRKGIIYWIFIGWWLEAIMWIFLTLPWLIIKIFKPKRNKTKATKQAICQSCGYNWKL